ncbi:tRNA (adenosine(37)-N6)-threonylcarbamoyltransferase complex dimerization subunit type 1 TsaB [Chloroflexota bacterium]
MYLAIDTATDMASLALVKDSEILAELTWRCERNHSVELLPRLAYLLSQTGVNLTSTSGIIVARGPGSFNGLRVGISVAKGLAFSLEIPVVGISSLEAAAYQHAATGLPVCPVFNAGRGEIATAMYQKQRNKWRQIFSEHITTVEALCSQITKKTIFCGDFIPVIVTQLKERLEQNVVVLTPAARLRRASFLAELGLKQFVAGSNDTPDTLRPVYLRPPHITKPKHC